MNSIIALIILILDVLAVVDVLKSKKDTGKKALWIILILLLPIVGLVLYYLVGRK